MEVVVAREEDSDFTVSHTVLPVVAFAVRKDLKLLFTLSNKEKKVLLRDMQMLSVHTFDICLFTRCLNLIDI